MTVLQSAFASELDVFSVANPERQDLAPQKVIRWLLGLYFSKNIRVEKQTIATNFPMLNLNWLGFRSSKGKFEVGIENQWDSPIGLQCLVESLHGNDRTTNEITDKFYLDSDAKPNLNLGLQLYQFECVQENQTFKAWLHIDDATILPVSQESAENNFRIKVDISIDISEVMVGGHFSLLHPKIVLQQSVVSNPRLSRIGAKIIFKKSESVLLIEEYQMSENPTLRTLIRMGTLDLKLDQLLALVPGSEIRFTMPENTAIELELAGQVVGRGEMRIENDNYVIGITEITVDRRSSKVLRINNESATRS